MKRYRVKFYLGLFPSSVFETPWETVELEAAENVSTEEVIQLAKKQLGAHPRAIRSFVEDITHEKP